MSLSAKMDSDDDMMDLEAPVDIPSEILALSERQMLYELSLPESLKNLSKTELHQWVLFRRTHTEIQWEAELVRRQEALSKALDFERLRKMKGEMAKAPTRKSTRGKKGLDSDEEDDIFGDSDDDAPLPDPNASAALLESDEDSILFDSDEERENTTADFKNTFLKNEKKYDYSSDEDLQYVSNESDDDEDDESGEDIHSSSSNEEIRNDLNFKHNRTIFHPVNYDKI